MVRDRKCRLESATSRSGIVIADCDWRPRLRPACSSGFRQDHLYICSFAIKDGSKVWERQFSATGRTSHYPTTSIATSTPASDGERIFALYSTNDLACLDLDGNLQWFRGLTYDYPNASNSLGMASSPIVVGSTLVTQIENDSESLATGIDVATGESRWTAVRPRLANWTSAVPWPKQFDGNEDLVLLQSGQGIDAIRPATGDLVWKYAVGRFDMIPSFGGCQWNCLRRVAPESLRLQAASTWRNARTDLANRKTGSWDK